MTRRRLLRLCASIAPALGTAHAMARQSPATRPAPRAEDAARLLRLGSRGVRAHDPSNIVKCKDEYWIFYTGPGVPSYRSKDLIEWVPGPRIFSEVPAWAAKAVPAHRGLSFWAPEVARVGDRFLVYYSVSTFGKNVSAIGLASNPTLDPADSSYHWSDEGPVIQSSTSDRFNAIDPAIAQDSRGGWWLAFGSFWSGIKLVQLDPATGRRISPDSPIHALAHSEAIEAACIRHHAGHYYLFLDWGVCCRGVDSTYNIRVGRSAKITGPYLDREGQDMLRGGGTLLLRGDGPFVGPGHPGIFEEGDHSWISMHFYDATRRGAPTLAIRPLRWADDGWPVVGEA